MGYFPAERYFVKESLNCNCENYNAPEIATTQKKNTKVVDEGMSVEDAQDYMQSSTASSSSSASSSASSASSSASASASSSAAATSAASASAAVTAGATVAASVATCLEADRFQVQRDLLREYRAIITEAGIDISYPRVVIGQEEKSNIKVTKKDVVLANQFVEEQKELSKDLEDEHS